LTFDHPEWGTSFGIFYNWKGPELVAAPGANLDESELLLDIYNDQSTSLDLTVSQKLTSWLQLKAGAKNILDPAIERYRLGINGEKLPEESVKKGIDFSLSLTAEF
jgi:outer membrane receptor for ferrienterochelin and colicin